MTQSFGARQGVRGLLLNFEKPTTDFLRFQYNPTGITERKNTQWAEADIPGGDNTLDTFGSGKSLQLSMQLLFNAYGEGKNGLDDFVAGQQVNFDFVENQLAFLHRFAQAAEGSPTNPGNAPDILLLSLGQTRFPGQIRDEDVNGANTSTSPVLPVRIAQLNIERTMFDKATYRTIRAMADLTLVRVIGFPR